MTYKGIDLTDNPHIKSYISTYKNAINLNTDKPLQKLIKKHHFKTTLLITTFNLSIIGIIISVANLIT